jgi:putative peptidoglycan lipid II flippase
MIGVLRAQHERFCVWQARSPQRMLVGSIVTIGGMTALVRLAGLAKQRLVAGAFGVSDDVEVFFVAVALPVFLAGLVQSITQATFLPTFVGVLRSQGREAAARLLSSTSAAMLVVLTVGVALIVANERAILHFMASGFDEAKLVRVRTVFHVLVPVFFATSVADFWAVVLNAERRFALAAIAPLAGSLGPIVALLVAPHAGLSALAGGTVAGAVANTAIVGWGVRAGGLPVLPRWHGLSPALRRVGAQAAPMLVGSLVLSTNAIIDQTMASRLGSGSVASLEYGRRIADVLVGIAAMALGTAVLPHFSRLVADREYDAIRQTLRTYKRLIAVAGAAGVLLLVPLSLPLVRLLLKGGAFSEADAVAVSRVQLCYVAQAPFYLIGILGVRLLSALGESRTLLVISCINVATNLVGDLVLMRLFGLPGIALSTACVYVISMCIILDRVRRKLPCA